MRMTFSLRSGAVLAALSILSGIGLAGCAGEANPARDLVAAVGGGPKVAQTPDFVAQSRPQSLDYLPVGASSPGRPTPARTADEIKAAEAELEALRTRNEAAGAAAAELGGTPAPEPVTLPKRNPASNRTP